MQRKKLYILLVTAGLLVLLVTVIALVIVVQGVQSLGDWAANKKDYKVRD